MVETIVPGCPAPIAALSYASPYASEFAYERVPDAIALAALLPASPTVCATSPLYRDTTPYSVASETVFARSPSAFVEDGKMVEELAEDDEDESMGDEASVASGERERSEDDVNLPLMGGKNKELNKNATGKLLGIYAEACLVLTKAQGIPPYKLYMLNPRLDMGNSPRPGLALRIMVSYNGGLNTLQMLIIRQIQKMMEWMRRWRRKRRKRRTTK